MKKILLTSLLILGVVMAYAQQAADIDPSAVTIPRYANLAAIQAALPITVAKQGMMVYNVATSSAWTYNGTAWANTAVSGGGTVVAPLTLTSNAATLTSSTTAAGEAGVKGITDNATVGFGVWGVANALAPSTSTYGVYGLNNSTNDKGVGVGGIHNGTGWGGFFGGTNALKTFGKTYLDGAVSITNANFLEFGKGLTKQEDNGKIAYNAFGEANTLSIVGGGTENDGSDRKIKMWANGGTIFTGGASFDKNVNIGDFDLTSTAKLQVKSNADQSSPSIAIVDGAFDNLNGGILQFRNQTGLHRFDIQALFGQQSMPTGSFLSFNKNGNAVMRLRGDGNLGLGVMDPTEKIHVDGNLNMSGEIKPSGNSGVAGQVLSSNGDGTMKWDDAGSIFGQIIEVLPSITDTAALRTKGYELAGRKLQTVERDAKQIGNIMAPIANDDFQTENELFYSPTLNKIFIVHFGSPSSTKITSFDLAEATYGTTQNFTVPSYNLNTTKAFFTGTKILVYPNFIFDCAAGTSVAFPANSCAGNTATKAQVWTGSKLISYSPTGGFTFDPATNVYTCIQHPTANIYYPGMSATWTGSVVAYYGGYLTVSGNKVSVDAGRTYNPTTNTWDDIAAGGPRVHDHSAVWSGSEVLFLGGTEDNGTPFSKGHLSTYNPSTFVWNVSFSDISTNPKSKAILQNNKIFFFNVSSLGVKKLLPSYFNVTSKTLQSYTTDYKHLNELSAAPVAVNNAIIYFTDHLTSGCVRTNYAYKLETSSTINIVPEWNVNVFTNAFKAIKGKHVLVQGQKGSWLLNTDTNQWKKTSSVNMPTPYFGQDVKAIVNSNKFMVWGGLNGSTYVKSGAIYDITSNTWTAVSTVNAPTESTNSSMGNGYAIFWDPTNRKLYNFATNTWTDISTTNAPTINYAPYWYNDKFISASASGIDFYNPTTNIWVNANLNTSFGGKLWTGKFIVEYFSEATKKVYNAETNEIKMVDFSEADNFFEFTKKTFVYDENRIIVANDQEDLAEVIDLTNNNVSYIPIKITNFNGTYGNSEVFKLPNGKSLLLDELNSLCNGPSFIEPIESLNYLNNTVSNITASYKLKTLVYKRK
jgi:hypothetical protein